MNKNTKLIIYTDGGARGNPGPAGIGAVIKDQSGKVLKEVSEYIGETTNNQAEYQAVVFAFKVIEKIKDVSELDFYLDSELVVKQLRGEYRVKNLDLQPWFVKIFNMSQKYKKVKYTHIKRDLNKDADRLANLAMDKKERGTISSVRLERTVHIREGHWSESSIVHIEKKAKKIDMFNFEKKGGHKKNILDIFFLEPLKIFYLRVYLVILLLLNLATWFLANSITYQQVIGKNIALHYSVDFGIDYYGPAEKNFYYSNPKSFFSGFLI